MARKKVSTTVYLEESQLQALITMSKGSRVPMAVLVRAAIDEFLESRRKPEPDARQIGLPWPAPAEP